MFDIRRIRTISRINFFKVYLFNYLEANFYSHQSTKVIIVFTSLTNFGSKYTIIDPAKEILGLLFNQNCVHKQFVFVHDKNDTKSEAGIYFSSTCLFYF